MPRWLYKVDVKNVFYDDELTFEQKKRAIVLRLKRSEWVRSKNEWDDLVMLVEELEDSADVKEFDFVWDAIYDEADYDRCWIATC